MQASEIHTITWSDHALISITISGSSTQQNSYIWLTNNYLIQQSKYSELISTQLSQFFTYNEGSVSDPPCSVELTQGLYQGRNDTIGVWRKKEEDTAFRLPSVYTRTWNSKKILPWPNP